MNRLKNDNDVSITINETETKNGTKSEGSKESKNSIIIEGSKENVAQVKKVGIAQARLIRMRCPTGGRVFQITLLCDFRN